MLGVGVTVPYRTVFTTYYLLPYYLLRTTSVRALQTALPFEGRVDYVHPSGTFATVVCAEPQETSVYLSPNLKVRQLPTYYLLLTTYYLILLTAYCLLLAKST